MRTKTTISDVPHVLHSIRFRAVPTVVFLGHFPHKNPVMYTASSKITGKFMLYSVYQSRIHRKLDLQLCILAVSKRKDVRIIKRISNYAVNRDHSFKK